MPEPLTEAVGQLLEGAQPAARSAAAAQTLAETRRRLDEPLRVALAGKVKAGKSTLLNALLGEELAPTDAGECTRIVTWYRQSDRPAVVVHTRDGRDVPRPFDRSGGAVEVDLGGMASTDVERLDVGWPTQQLAGLTLIDTPGIASLSTDLSAETYRALSPEDDRPSQADAVVYLLRHAHASDIRFLEAFHDDELAHGTSLNAVGVLGRADEIGAGASDALEVAQRVARRYQEDPRLQQLCPVIVPVAGLLGFAGETLREQEHRALCALADGPVAEVDDLLLTADRFANRPSTLPVTELDRQHLLDRLGLFGVRLAIQLARIGVGRTPGDLQKELVQRSGLTRLRDVLLSQFSRRARVLKARSALAALSGLLSTGDLRDAPALRARLEEITAGAHEFAEIRLLNSLRSGALLLRDDRAEELERVMGAHGHDAASRLGAPAGTSREDLRQVATDALARWRRLAQHPLSDRTVQHAAAVVVRTIEGLLDDLEA